ncbi:hypothetical protein [Streptomyces macrosporus]|uniref:Lipoprotein n=1 Tax=Streptomyces macrosporus TaxID=44032 RepID=A0ABP5WKU7_9ACTN
MHLHAAATTTPRGPVPARRHGPGTAVAVCLMVLSAGCGSSDGAGGVDDGAKKPRTSPAASAAPSRSASPTPSPTPTPTTSSPSPTYTATEDLSTCHDGECTVEVQAGDTIRFGGRVRVEPPIDSLLVVDVNTDGPTLMLSSGMTTTAYGTIEINDGLRVETLHSDGTSATIRIDRVA